ncbi:hypothetical protein TSOC_002056 [Tetrabaena socialis]|uniref:Uncharacterized protein n=1 Tax=Tetrabaena socialis TaxID=47790 RepID=A0A2J8AF34_9CHLO|nr:hypothetical protein TSOC_002056 [Tetrabaena socialis]|eukprot:PNH11131.1 hypothetical protein TSOC_002056 [Tetrabaena socialis]
MLGVAPIRTKRDKADAGGARHRATPASSNPATVKTRSLLASAAEHQERVRCNKRLSYDDRTDELAALAAIKSLLERLDACVMENENPPDRDSKKHALVSIEKARQDVLAAARECALRVTTCQELFDEIECFVQLRPEEDITPRKLEIKWRRSQPPRQSKQRRDQVAKRVARPGESLVASIVGLFAIAEGTRDSEEERDTLSSSADATSRPRTSGGPGGPKEKHLQQQHSGNLPPAAPSAREAALLAARGPQGSEGGGDDLRRSLSHDVPESSAATTTMCNMDSCASGHRTARTGAAGEWAHDCPGGGGELTRTARRHRHKADGRAARRDYARADEGDEDEVSSAERSRFSDHPFAAGSGSEDAGSEDAGSGSEPEAVAPAVVLSQLPPGVLGPRALMAPAGGSQEAAPGSATSIGAAAAGMGGQSLRAMGRSAATSLLWSAAEAASARMGGGGAAGPQLEYGGGGLAASAEAVAAEGGAQSVTMMAAALRSQEEIVGNRSYVAQDPRRRPSGQTTAAAILQLRAAERDAAAANAAVAAAAAAMPADDLRDFPMSYPPGVVAAAAVALAGENATRAGSGGGDAGGKESGAEAARAHAPSVPASRHSQECWEVASIAETEPLSGAPGRAGRGLELVEAGPLSGASVWEEVPAAAGPLSGGSPGRHGGREGRRRGSRLLGLVRGVVGFVGVSVLSGAAMVLGAAAVNTSLDEQEAMRSGASRTSQAARRAPRLGRGGDDLIPQRTLQQLRGPDLLALGKG